MGSLACKLGWGLEIDIQYNGAGMNSRDRQRIGNGRSDAFGTSGASPLFRLSATMVELSLRHKLSDVRTDVPAKPSIKLDCYSAEARGPLISSDMAGSREEGSSQAAQLDHNESGRTRREILRTSISRICDQSVKTFAWLRTRTGIVALALVAFPIVYAFHHQPDSVKSQSQIPPVVQQRERPLVSSIASQETHHHAQAVAPKKVKSRRHQSDYIAKDTYIYYGKEGKPSH
jgi:hypothetical protein